MALRSKWQEDMVVEIMGMIVKKVGNIGDYVRMTSVCKSWRSMLAHYKPVHDVEAPWILQLKDCVYNHDKGFNFYSLSEGRFYSIKLPAHIFHKYPNVVHSATFCCTTSNGWLVLVAGRSDNHDLFLFDPISQIDVKLPSMTTIPFPPYFENITIPLMFNKVQVFSISDDPTDRNIVVLAHLADMLKYDTEILAFCNCDIGVTEEERSWKIFDADKAILGRSRIESILFHNGVLYTLVSNYDEHEHLNNFKRIDEEINHVVVLKTDCCEVKMKIINIVRRSTAPHIRPIDNEPRWIAYSCLKYVYLAKSIKGELLIVWNTTDPLSQHDEHDEEDEEDEYDVYDVLDIYHTSKLTIERYEGVYKKDREFKSMTSLDDEALFVSPNSNSFSIPATSGCEANCIYFTVDGLDLLWKKSLSLYRQSGIYCMQQKKIKRPFPSPPLWFQPRLGN